MFENKILNRGHGHYSFKKINAEFPLFNYNRKSSNEIHSLTLKDIDSSTLEQIPYLRLHSLKNLATYNKSFYSNLYSLYVVLYLLWKLVSNSKAIEAQEACAIEKLLTIFENSELLALKEKLDIFSLLREIKLRTEISLTQNTNPSTNLHITNSEQTLNKNYFEIEEKKHHLKMLDLLFHIEDQEKYDLKRLREWIEGLNLERDWVLKSLNDTNTFIAQCQALQAALPNVKIYY
ncbi:MAG: hypothetical protein IPM82_07680 [Saprospiraceae bacterium]|nr:hypothetical protein [Saprospiraceae bacterium]